MCIGLHTLPPCLLFCGNYILHESEYDVHIFCVALDIIIYPAPHSAPAWMPGVYAQRLCTMQSQQSIHSPSPMGRDLGLGIENLLYFYKNRLFLQTESLNVKGSLFFIPLSPLCHKKILTFFQIRI